MYSLAEDDYLAQANSRRCLTLDALVALSAVCGCGLDMVPIPGTSFPEEVAALILDIAALSCTLRKPLGVRLLPIPNRAANEFTQFNLDFLCDTRIIGLAAGDRRLATSAEALQYLAARG
jgi:uncharacterized protein (UPF0210 family)